VEETETGSSNELIEDEEDEEDNEPRTEKLVEDDK
jgi:hypothetical protein